MNTHRMGNQAEHSMVAKRLGWLLIALAIGGAGATGAQNASRSISYDGPIIDVHLHTDPPVSLAGRPNPATGALAVTSPEALRDATIEECERYNIVRAVLNGSPEGLDNWEKANPERFLPAPMILERDRQPVIEVGTLRQMFADGKVAALGEIIGQYVGLRPDDPVLEPYWSLAEEMDVPVMIHTGTSAPATAYSGYPAFRLALGNPLLLEEVLVRHPRLRVWIAHGGEPWTQETFALMHQYPQVYMDISTICWISGPAGRPGFHAFLQQAVRRGFGKRILFGSDQMAWPDAIGLAIEGVDSAPFLSPEQKRDIFYANAVRFLRLNEPLE